MGCRNADPAGWLAPIPRRCVASRTSTIRRSGLPCASSRANADATVIPRMGLMLEHDEIRLNLSLYTEEGLPVKRRRCCK